MGRVIGSALLVFALTGCGPHVTRAMWRADLPDHQPARALAATGRVLATPVTVVVDGTGAVLEGIVCEPDFWEFALRVSVGILEGCARVACR